MRKRQEIIPTPEYHRFGAFVTSRALPESEPLGEPEGKHPLEAKQKSPAA